jgi:hypothetical protein
MLMPKKCEVPEMRGKEFLAETGQKLSAAGMECCLPGLLPGTWIVRRIN